jgi:polyhydroxyalkanoate synthesis regulator protein
LGQIVREQESKEDQPLLPSEFMLQLIRFYGDTLRSLLSCYLDFSVATLKSQSMRNQMAQTGASVIGNLDEQVKRNVELFERLLASFGPSPTIDNSDTSHRGHPENSKSD